MRRTTCQGMISPFDAEYLRKRIYYNSENGIFLWRDSSKGHKAWSRAGTTRKGSGYLVIGIHDSLCYGHRLAWLYEYGEWPNGLIDHIDGVGSNNAISNLRVVDKKTNAENMKGPNSANKAVYLGVHKQKINGLYAAIIKNDGKQNWLGQFKTAEEASEAYLVAKRKMHKGCTI